MPVEHGGAGAAQGVEGERVIRTLKSVALVLTVDKGALGETIDCEWLSKPWPPDPPQRNLIQPFGRFVKADHIPEAGGAKSPIHATRARMASAHPVLMARLRRSALIVEVVLPVSMVAARGGVRK